MLRRCLGCMEEFDEEYRVCPFCGYIVGTHPEGAIQMRPGVLLHNRYIVGKVLGYGGFGVTYIGWDGRLEQKVAIKEYLPSDFSTRMPGHTQITVLNGDKSEQFYDGLRKFVEEAKRLARFQNEPGIVKIFDSFEENDTAYIVMEYLDGETLTKHLDKVGTIPANEAVEMLQPIMKSLEVIHSEGILHRDIAPDNIFLTKTGEVKLIDFGASRYATTSHSKSLTVIIKQGYSPEEQYRSRGDQGSHTDVYALSATLYKMITGKITPDAMERRAKYENKNKDILVKPHKLKKDLSHIYENAILNALNVRIEDRTSTIAEFMEELTAEKPAKRRINKIEPLDIYNWPVWLKVALSIVLVGFLTFGALLGNGTIKFESIFSDEIKIPENIVMVPEVEELFYKEAYERLNIVDENGEQLFNVCFSDEGTFEAEYISAGKIIEQSPKGGTYQEKGVEIVLTISGGNKVAKPENGIATVPFVQFDNEEDAVKKIKTAGLKEPKIKKQSSDIYPEGTVIEQSHDAGAEIETKDKNKKGNIITLTISSGPASFKMPDVKGVNIDEAKELLEEKNLKITIKYEASEEYEVDSVIRQSIKADKKAKRGSDITLVVASKVTDKIISVANVKGLSSNEATRILKKQGLKVEEVPEYSDSVTKGYVIRQFPDAGESLNLNTDSKYVTIVVSKGTEPSTTTSTTKPTTTKPTTSSPTTTQAQKVTVYFNANLGSVSPSSKEYVLGSRYADLPVPTRKGYTFDGWVTSLLTGGKVTSDNTVNLTGDGNEIYLYAKWNPNKYTVKLDTNGGSISDTEVTVEYGRLYYSYLPTPKKDGYTFDGWYKNYDFSGSPISLISTVNSTSDHILYAKWSRNVVSDWVSESSVPAGAEIVEKKYVYDVTDYKTSSSSSLSGYTLDNSKGNNGITTNYGAWNTGDWTTEKRAESDVVALADSKTESKVTSYDMKSYCTQEARSPYYRMYRDYSIGGNYGAYGARQSYGEHTWSANWSVSQFNSATKVSPGSFGSNIKYAGYNRGNKTAYLIPNSNYEYMYYIVRENVSTTTYYKYKERTKSIVYNFKKVETKESSSYPSGSNVSNIRTMVKYRAK